MGWFRKKVEIPEDFKTEVAAMDFGLALFKDQFGFDFPHRQIEVASCTRGGKHPFLVVDVHNLAELLEKLSMADMELFADLRSLNLEAEAILKTLGEHGH